MKDEEEWNKRVRALTQRRVRELYICINSYTFRSNDFLKKLYER